MRKLSVTLIILTLSFLYACQKEPLSGVGFSSEIAGESSGLTILHVYRNVKNVYLEGSLVISEGEVQVNLLNPEGIEVYSQKLECSERIVVSKTFKASPGYWKLKYKSNHAGGRIDLHLQYLDKYFRFYT